MPKVQQQGMHKGGKAVQRAGRLSARTQAMRSTKIARSRKHHLKNARRSCGVEFAKALERYYLLHPLASVPTKHGRGHG